MTDSNTNPNPETGSPPVAAPSPSRLRLGLLAAGLPALVAAATLLVVPSLGSGKTLTDNYEREAAARLKRDDLPGALVCYKRLMALSPERPEVRFAIAMILERLGRGEQAESIARSIAPEDATGFPAAHFLIARRILADRGRLAQRAGSAEGHLLRFLQANPRSPEAKLLLGYLYASTGRPGEARPYLEEAAGTQPDRLLELARVCRALGDRDEALRRARAALDAAKRRAEAQPDDKLARLVWANACVLMDDYPGAVQVLEKGLTLSKDPAFARNIASVCSAWAESMERNKARTGDRLAVLQLGLKYDEANGPLLTQVGAIMRGEGDDAEKARAEIRAALAQGRAPSLAHFLLGSEDWARGRIEPARNHWEQALRIDPKAAIVANNLAWILAYHEPADLPRANALIDQAVSLIPGDPKLRGTRGEIYLKMGRWKDAVTEIEAAFAGGADTPAFHSAIAAAYDRLGMPEMAAAHRKP